MRHLRESEKGFTLIELMITLAVVAVLASIALPAYSAYVQRSRVPPGLDALSSYAVRMEQRFQDTGNYGSTGCGITPMPTAKNYTVNCVLGGGGQSFTATASGTGVLNGYVYTIDETGTRKTTAHPKGVPAQSCWSIRGAICDD